MTTPHLLATIAAVEAVELAADRLVASCARVEAARVAYEAAKRRTAAARDAATR